MSEDHSSQSSGRDAPAPSVRGEDHHEGQLIGDKYRLVKRLGEGGMASVWLAHNEALDIDVAIKFIRADLQHPGLTSRLLQEARAAARLGHPAIVRVTDFGKTEGAQPYIVMELLSGEDLSKQIATRGALPPVRAVRLLLPIAHALAAAHDKGIVHRDLKPENIFLHQQEGGSIQPKLVDFGIAKLESKDDQRITQLGAAMGSPAYMSPEQARGLDVDPRADVWAFSILLYETLTAKLPFDGPTYAALLCAILESAPKPITELGVPDPELWALIAHGLEKEPDRRWASMREFGTALAHWLSAQGVADDVAGASLLSTWIDPQPESDRPRLHSLPSIPDDLRPSLLHTTGRGATQLAFHDGAAAQPASRQSFGKLVAIGAGIGGVLLIGGAIALLGSRTQATELPPAPAASVAPEPAAASTAEVVPAASAGETASDEPVAEPPASANEPPQAPAEPTSTPASTKKPLAKTGTARPRSAPKPASTTASKPAAPAKSAPSKPKPADELDIKTNL